MSKDELFELVAWHRRAGFHPTTTTETIRAHFEVISLNDLPEVVAGSGFLECDSQVYAGELSAERCRREARRELAVARHLDANGGAQDTEVDAMAERIYNAWRDHGTHRKSGLPPFWELSEEGQASWRAAARASMTAVVL